MATAVKMMRLGRKHLPYFRIVIIDKHKKRESKVLETIGYYNPNAKENKLDYNREQLNKWIKQGAILSDGVRKIIKL